MAASGVTLAPHKQRAKIMSIIEKEMLEAIANKSNWRKGNTLVQYTLYGTIDFFKVFLHGNLIATVNGASKVVDVEEETLVNFPTKVTLSRLRALGVDVSRKGGKVFLYGEPL